MMRDPLAPTWGAEEEGFICDAGTMVPVTPIAECGEMLKRQLGSRFSLEYKACVGELITRVHTDPFALSEEVAANRFEARSILERFGYQYVPLATHPRAVALEAPARDDDRYHWIEGQKGNAVKNLLVNGGHMHVGTYESDLERLQALPALLPLVAIHAAATACSPFFDGRETGQATWRLRVLNQLAPALPFTPKTVAEHHRLIKALADAGGPRDASEHWGLLRLGSNGKPTVEFRAADTCPSLDHIVWLAALSGAAVHAQRIGYLQAPATSNANAIFLANLDRIAGDGPAAMLIDPYDISAKTLSEYVQAAIDRVAASISALNLADAIAHIPRSFDHHADALRNAVKDARDAASARGLSDDDARTAGQRAGADWAVGQSLNTPNMSWIAPRRIA